jgi:hypothetical protein
MVAVTKVVLASIYANFTTTIEDDEGTEHEDGFMGSPVKEGVFTGG